MGSDSKEAPAAAGDRAGAKQGNTGSQELDGAKSAVNDRPLDDDLDISADGAATGPDEWLKLIGDYTVNASGLFLIKHRFKKETIKGGDGKPKITMVPAVDHVQLTNFPARIRREIVQDDGSGESARVWEIEAAIGARKAVFQIPASQFASLAWVAEHLGPAAIVYPGQSIREHARTAIQTLSDPKQERVYVRTGWVEDPREGWIFLHAGGGLGRNGPIASVLVELPEALKRIDLPAPRSHGQARADVLASLKLIEAAPPHITAPLLAAVYGASFGPAPCFEHLSGFTGSGKTELAALMQQHFGAEMNAQHLPASWNDTANSLMETAFKAADVLLVIDEFKPDENSVADANRMRATFEKTMRAVGNQSARSRGFMGDAGVLKVRAPRPPRCSIISTGEEMGGGASLRARGVNIEVAPRDIGRGDIRALTPYQRAAAQGQYAGAMADYIIWLAGDLQKLRGTFVERWHTYRDAQQGLAHARTATNHGWMLAAWEMFTAFALDIGAISEAQRKAIQSLVLFGITKASRDQGETLRDADPVRKFFALLSAVFTAGKGHIACADSSTGRRPSNADALGWKGEEPQGQTIGWVDDKNNLYLQPDATMAVVRDMAHHSGAGALMNSPDLFRRLEQRGKLLSTGRNTSDAGIAIRIRLAGARRYVLHLSAFEIVGKEENTPDIRDTRDNSGKLYVVG